METLEAVEQPVQHRQHLMVKLRLATIRLEDAPQERIGGMLAAAKANAFNQQIIATGLSPHRVHQLRTTGDAQEIHVRLCQLPEHYPFLRSGGS